MQIIINGSVGDFTLTTQLDRKCSTCQEKQITRRNKKVDRA